MTDSAPSESATWPSASSSSSWDFVWDFAPVRGAYPLTRPAPARREASVFAGPSRNGETRTRTGGTTIFRESAGPVRRHKMPASAEVFVGVPSLRCPRFRAVPRGFGTLLAPRSPSRQRSPTNASCPTGGAWRACSDNRTLSSRASATLGSRTGSERHAACQLDRPAISGWIERIAGRRGARSVRLAR